MDFATSTLPAWLSIPLVAYLAGLATAIGIALVISHRQAVVQAVKTRGQRIARWLMGVWNRKMDRGVEGGEEAALGSGRREREKKPFEFRKRLWNEPPEDWEIYGGSYEEHLGHFDAVQKKFKEVGGKDLEWKTNWLDVYAERALLHNYWLWANGEVGRSSEGEAAFYAELRADLELERHELSWDDYVSYKTLGHSRDEGAELLRVVNEMQEEAAAKRRGDRSRKERVTGEADETGLG